MKKIIKSIIVSMMLLTLFTINVSASVVSVSVKSFSQNANSLIFEFESDDSNEYAKTYVNSISSQSKAHIQLIGTKYDGYVYPGAISKINDLTISISKQEMKWGYFPNDTYTFYFLVDQNVPVCSKANVAVTGLIEENELHYREATSLTITGVEVPVAGNKAADSLKNAKVTGVISGVTKEDLYEKGFVGLFWSTDDLDYPHLEVEKSDTEYFRLDTRKNDEGFINLNVKGLSGEATTISITLNNDEPYQFSGANIEKREWGGGLGFGLKVDDGFLTALKNNAGKSIAISDGITSLTENSCQFHYNQKDIDINDNDYTFKENTTYTLSIVYEYLKDNPKNTQTPQCNTTVNFGYRTFPNFGGSGYGGNATCSCLGYNVSKSTFQTTSVGQPSITNIEDISLNVKAAQDLKDIVNSLVHSTYYEETNYNYDIVKKAIEGGKAIVIRTDVEENSNPTNITVPSGDNLLGALDIGVYIDVEGENSVNITELPSPLTFEYKIPDGVKANTSYYIRRNHNGVVETINGSVVGDKVIFETDKFSTYALCSHYIVPSGGQSAYKAPNTCVR